MPSKVVGMFSWKTWGALVVVLAVAALPTLAFVDRELGHGGPAPEDYYREMSTMGRYGGARCAGSDGVTLVRLGGRQLHHIYPGAGGDTFIAGTGTPFVTFDFDSPRTGESHDILVVAGVVPDQLDFSRQGPHLLICGRADAMEIIIARQYCHGDSAEGPWNNQYEEIVFPSVREIWLADELYDAFRAGGDLPAISRADEIDQLQASVTQAPERWIVRPFSDALPSDWFAAYACRRDLN